jgi:hypothetical protein
MDTRPEDWQGDDGKVKSEARRFGDLRFTLDTSQQTGSDKVKTNPPNWRVGSLHRGYRPEYRSSCSQVANFGSQVTLLMPRLLPEAWGTI